MRYIFFLSGILLSGCTHKDLRQPAGATDIHIHLISTSDLHGYLLPEKSPAGLTIGGIDTLQAYFKIAKDIDPQTLLLDEGDLFQGTIISNSADGVPVVKWMNAAGYTATAIGNHDFDFGPGHGHSTVRVSGEDPLGALKGRISEANFDFLSANICSIKEDPGGCEDPNSFLVASFAKPFKSVKIWGINIAIIGLTTVSTPSTTMPSNVADLRFMPLKPSLERQVTLAKQQGAQMILLLMHDGGECKAHGDCESSGAIFKLIDSLSPETKKSLPLILGGHTHNDVNVLYHGVRVVIPACEGKVIAYTDLAYHPLDQSVTVEATQNVDVCPQVFANTKSCFKGSGDLTAGQFLGEEVHRDPDALKSIAEDIKAAEDKANTTVGRLLSGLTKEAKPESSLGDFVTDAMRNCQNEGCDKPVDFAFYNDTGFRTGNIAQGDVTYGEVFEALPFDNSYALVYLTGLQIHDLIESWLGYAHVMPQISGLKINFTEHGAPRTMSNKAKQSKTLPDPILSMTTTNGEPIEESKTYSVALPDFLASGGSGMAFVMNQVPVQIFYGRMVRDVVIDYFKSQPKGLDYSQGDKRLIQSQ